MLLSISNILVQHHPIKEPEPEPSSFIHRAEPVKDGDFMKYWEEEGRRKKEMMDKLSAGGFDMSGLNMGGFGNDNLMGMMYRAEQMKKENAAREAREQAESSNNDEDSSYDDNDDNDDTSSSTTASNDAKSTDSSDDSSDKSENSETSNSETDQKSPDINNSNDKEPPTNSPDEAPSSSTPVQVEEDEEVDQYEELDDTGDIDLDDDDDEITTKVEL